MPSTDRETEWFKADEAVEGIKTYLRLLDYPVDKLLRKRRLRALLK